MKKSSLYNWLATVAVCIGIGMLLGAYLASDTPSKTPFWIGGILVFLGAVVFGMAVGTNSFESSVANKNSSKDTVKSDQTEYSSIDSNKN